MAAWLLFDVVLVLPFSVGIVGEPGDHSCFLYESLSVGAWQGLAKE